MFASRVHWDCVDINMIADVLVPSLQGPSCWLHCSTLMIWRGVPQLMIGPERSGGRNPGDFFAINGLAFSGPCRHMYVSPCRLQGINKVYTVECFYNAIQYKDCIHHCNYWCRIWIRLWTHRRRPISCHHKLWAVCYEHFGEDLSPYNDTAPYVYLDNRKTYTHFPHSMSGDFLQNIHKIHNLARPLGCDMECLLWVDGLLWTFICHRMWFVL